MLKKFFAESSRFFGIKFTNFQSEVNGFSCFSAIKINVFGLSFCRHRRVVCSQKGKKNGAPLSPNLINLKSNTMKNTMQRYGFSTKLARVFSFFLQFYVDS